MWVTNLAWPYYPQPAGWIYGFGSAVHANYLLSLNQGEGAQMLLIFPIPIIIFLWI